ncbi:sulfatase [Thermophilibacter provencensis]|uniref:Sulfatase n=1 Tax=Thermophilibacter provencensis TaxID=1852386 RepID=A0A921GF08_9ACTN|nr:sulfatase [Thermophilibacter provencensis]MBM6814708.1 sulfatase-like hydrolase/transferase [Olsenella uli]HJF45570.1 sulfatase [Thermophilibacter provencensis]
MRTVLVLMDTLRRDALGCYNPGGSARTPNLDAFSSEAVTFDNHWIGSAPCMPARRDIMCGRYNFLERPWGPIEPFDVTLVDCLRAGGVRTHISTDHCHYARTGGEGYLQLFNTFEFFRGQEGDPWVSRIDEPDNMPETFYGRVREQYQKNRLRWPSEEDMPSPRTFRSACEFIDQNEGKDDFFLMVEAFDPHEPFDVPDRYMDEYGGSEGLDRDYFEIPPYKRVSDTDIPESAVDYVQRRYKALVTMTDHWFGTLVDKLKEKGMYEGTTVIVTTDHGYFLGSRDYLGKNYMHMYNEMAHLPLIVKFPHGERAGERAHQLTQAIDIMPTVLEAHGRPVPETVMGTSLMPLATDAAARTREYALYGVHAMTVNVTDGRHTYFRAPVPGNQPCYEYAAIPHTIRKKMGTDCVDQIEMGRFLSWTDYPVYRFPCRKPANIDQREDCLEEVHDSMLFDLKEDYGQTHNLVGEDADAEARMVGLLRRGLEEHGAPAEQFARLGLA